MNTNHLSIFGSKEFGPVRTATEEGAVWFAGRDVAKALGYTNPMKAIRDHVEEEDKGVNEMVTRGGVQNLIMVNESGLYALILGSKLPRAKAFKTWVTGEVLPAIRKTGGYLGRGTMTDADIMARAVAIAARTMEAQKKEIAEKDEALRITAPKAFFADAVAASGTTILIGDMAKLLKQNGLDIGAYRLFARLREEGYLISRRGADWNMPTQRAMNLGLFTVKETAISHADGHVTVQKTPKVTGKGQQYFVKKYLGGRHA